MIKLTGNKDTLLKYIDTAKIGQILLIATVLIFTLKFFQSTPFERIFFQVQAVFLVVTVVFLVSYVVITVRRGDSINEIVLYFLILISVIPLYSMFRASTEFGQPFIYGVLSERSWLLAGIGIWFYYLITQEKMALTAVESAFVFMAWASLVIFSLFVLFYTPDQIDFQSKFVRMSAERGLRFRFQMYFIIFGALYYFVKFTLYRNLKYLVILLLFLVYVLFVHQSRTCTVALSLTFLLYICFNYPLRRIPIILLKLSLFILIALIVIHALKPGYLDRTSHLFLQSFKVLTGELSEDPSANSRIFQSKKVLSYFDTHPLSAWLGVGRISNRWNDGYRSLFGHFYPCDIGVLGGLFLYGIPGLVFIFIIPVVITIKTVRRVSGKGNVFLKALKYMLVFAIIRSIQGSFYFSPMVYVIPLFILMAYKDLEVRSGADCFVA